MQARRALLALPALLAARPAVADWRDGIREIRYGILSSENERDAIARLQGLAAFAERRLGVPLRVSRGTDYAAVVEALRSNQLEFAYLGPAAYALAHRSMGERVIPLLRYRGRDGSEGYHAVIFVRADSPFQRIEDLRGRSFAFADPNSTSGYAFPAYFLRRQGFDPTTFFGRTGFSGSHEQSVIAVLNGTFDAGATFWTNEASGNIQRMTEKGMIPPGATRIIWTSPLIPSSPICTRAEVPEDLRRDFVAMLNALPTEAPEVLRQMSANAAGFAPARHEDYADVIAVIEENAARRRARRP